MGHGDPPLGLLHHVGLVPQVDVDDGWGQLAGLSVHLHGDGLVGGEGHFFTLMESLAVTSHLQCGLDTNIHRSVKGGAAAGMTHLTCRLVSLDSFTIPYRTV